MLRKLPAILALVLLSVLLLAAGCWMLFSHFAPFDDEGYILLSVQSYLIHGGLYTKVYSQYGPFFYVLLDGIHRLTGFGMDHSFARIFTLILWFGCAACTAALVGRASRSRALAVFVLCATFLYHNGQSEEPFHPGSVIIFILAAALYAVCGCQRREAWIWCAVISGSAFAMLALTKINVGLFFLAGLSLWILLTAPLPRSVRLGGLIGLLGCAAGLMNRHLGEPWVGRFLAVFGAGLFGLSQTITGTRKFGWRHLAAFTLGACVVAAAVLLVVLRRGTTPAGLLEGILLGPLRHPDNYFYAVDWRPGTLPLAAVACLMLLLHSWLKRNNRPEAADRLVGILRLLQLGGLLVALALLIDFRVVGVIFSFSLPWLWVWLVPLGRESPDDKDREARPLLACMLLLQSLHAYPVGGSQENWGTFLLFALAALAIPETISWLESGRRVSRHLRPILLALCVVVVTAKLGWVAWVNRQAYGTMTDMGLPGTAGMRMSEREVRVYQTLVYNSVVHSDMLFSLPGMCSFNLWSELPAPTLKNTTLWFNLLDETEQAAVIHSLDRMPRSCLIVQQGLLQILQSNGFTPAGPLYSHLQSHYQRVFTLDGFSFCVNRGRHTAPIGVAGQFQHNAGVFSFRACVVAPAHAVAEIDVFPAAGARQTAALHLTAANAQVTVQPINPDGSSRGSPYPAKWPLRCTGLVWLSVSGTAGDLPWSPSQLAMKGATGDRLGTALFGDLP